MQLWQGRFSKAVDSRVNDFNSSIRFDRRMAAQDITGSMAHAAMLTGQGIISEADGAAIQQGLEGILADLESGALANDPAAEDIHTFVEAELTKRIGEPGKRLHTGRSRNDQVGLTFRLFVADRLTAWQQRAAHLCATLVSCADGHQDDILPGCTHMQPAQPVSLAHHLLAYAWMFRRDCMRLDDVLKRVRISPLGSAALAGTTYPLDPQSVADEVGFDGIYGNSMDAVSDRDFVLEALFAGSCIMAHLSRLCEELIIWANPAFGFVQLSDGYSTGSSIMPQKKNPDVAELMRGKTGRVYGALMGMLTIMKGLPMTYNRDLQEDKEAVFDQVDTLEVLLPAFTGMVATMVFDKERLEAEAPTGFALATDIAEWLVKNGVPFRHAHELSGACVKIAEDRGQELWDLTDEDFINVFKDFLPADKAPQVREVLSTEGSVSARNGKGGTSPLRVREQIVSAKTTIEQLRAFANSVSDGSAYKSPESLLK